MLKKLLIKCPYCNREYLPAEIYYPDKFFGRPTDIVKDENGQILGSRGTGLDTTEEYYCDNCGKLFSVEASINFKTSQVVDLFADDDEFLSIKK